MPKRKPKYVPPVDADGEYTVDAVFGKLFHEQTPKEPRARGAAYRAPPSPPPEEARPVRRQSPPVNDQPRQTGQPNP